MKNQPNTINLNDSILKKQVHRRVINDTTMDNRSRGMSLVPTLMVMIIISLLAAAAARMALFDQQVSRNQRDQDLAFQGAQAALRDATIDLTASASAVVIAPRNNALLMGINTNGCYGTTDTCPAGTITPVGSSTSVSVCTGMCTASTFSSQTYDFLSDAKKGSNAKVSSVKYGLFTGGSTFSGRSAYQPRYIIEPLAMTGIGGNADANASAPKQKFVRVTAIGFGSNENTQVRLQSTMLLQ